MENSGIKRKFGYAWILGFDVGVRSKKKINQKKAYKGFQKTSPAAATRWGVFFF
jgi:hypothetical protein